MAFISWFNQKNQVESRLLTFDEYMEISPFSQPIDESSNLTFYTPPILKMNADGSTSPIGQRNKEFEYNCLSFFQENGDKIFGHPPYMKEDAFQKLQLKFDYVNYLQKQGLKFIDS